MTADLFARTPQDAPLHEPLAEDAWVLRGAALAATPALLAAVDELVRQAPWRHMATAGGGRMSVAMTNCGAVGWVSDARGYRYAALDPLTGRPWPALPAPLRDCAAAAARAAGWPAFAPDAGLVNRYDPGARLALHQDRNERDLGAPIVSISLGLPAVFLFGGLRRDAPVRRVRLEHGDIAVWGGASRLAYHGVAPLAPGSHPATGACRINLTLRQAR